MTYKKIYSTKYYIFGSGKTARIFKSILERNGSEVVSFLTSTNSSLSILEGIPVINLSEKFLQIEKKIPVIIGVFNREDNASMNFIVEFLCKLDFKHIISLYDFYNEYSDQIGSLYWLADKTYYEKNLSRFLLGEELFFEQKSLDTIESILSFINSFDFRHLPIPCPELQYFPDSINIWNGKDAFLDIGSFDGQTLLDAYSKYGKLQTAIAFEPDPLNIQNINRKIRNLKIADQIFLIPCGVWSKTETLKFSSGGGESSSIHNDGDIQIQCLSLDETLLEVIPGYIKMDIEGAEFEALKGSENLIKKYSPSLAISLYHRPDHLFEIPLLINSWNLGYNFYLRTHGNNLFETILYCTKG